MFQTLRSDLDVLIALYRTRKENPLVRHNPLARGHIPRRWIGSFIMIACWATAVVLFKVLAQLNDAVFTMLTIVLFGFPILAISAFYFFGFRHREKPHIEDLYLTSFPRGDVAFGASYWGAIAYGWMVAPFLLSFFLLVILDDSTPFKLLGLAVFSAIFSLPVALQGWLMFGPNLLSFIRWCARINLLYGGYLFIIFIFVHEFIAPSATNQAGGLLGAVIGWTLFGIPALLQLTRKNGTGPRKMPIRFWIMGLGVSSLIAIGPVRWMLNHGLTSRETATALSIILPALGIVLASTAPLLPDRTREKSDHLSPYQLFFLILPILFWWAFIQLADWMANPDAEMIFALLNASLIVVFTLGQARRLQMAWIRKRRSGLIGLALWYVVFVTFSWMVVEGNSLLQPRIQYSWSDARDWIAAVFTSIVGLMLLVYRMHQAGKFAGEYYFAPVDPDALNRVEWLSNEHRAYREKPERRRVLKRLRELNRADRKSRWTAMAIGCLTLLAAGLLAGWNFYSINPYQMTHMIHSPSLYRLSKFLVMIQFQVLTSVSTLWAVIIISTASMVLLRARRRPDGRLPIISGSIFSSVFSISIVSMIPWILLFLASAVWQIWLFRPDLQSDWLPVLIFMSFLIFSMIALSVGVAASLFPRGVRPRAWIAAGWILLAAILETVPILTTTEWDNPNGPPFFLHSSNTGIGVDLLGAAICLTLLLIGIPWFFQRIHGREVNGLPRHTLTTESLEDKNTMAV